MMPLASRAFHVFHRPIMGSILQEGFETEQFGEAVAAVATHGQHEAHQHQQHGREGEDEVGQFRNCHQQVRQGCRDQGAQGDLEGVTAATLFPVDRQALDGHGQDHHREQRYGQGPLDTQLVTEQADDGDDDHHEGEHDRQSRQHLQLQMFQVGTQRQAEGGDQREQGDTPTHLGLAEGQGDQYRGKGAQGLDADQVTQDQDHQDTDRDHDHHLVDLLRLQGQAVQGVLQQGRGAVLGGHLGQAQGVHFTVVDGEAHVAVTPAVQLQQGRVAGPPDQAVLWNTLLPGFRMEVQPALAVVAAQPQLRLLVRGGLEADGMHQLQRNARVGQQYVDYPCLVQRSALAAEQQADIVVGDVIDPANGLADEGLDIRRVLANRVDQGVRGDLLRAVQGDRLAGCRWPCFDGLGAVTLGQDQAIVEGLGATGAAGRPGDPAIAVLLVDADSVVIGDEALVDADELLIQRWNEQLRLDRHAGTGLEIDFRIQTPDIIGLILPHGDVEYIYLVAGNKESQTDHQGNQDF